MEDQSLEIIEGRHPSVELSMHKSGEDSFYSNKYKQLSEQEKFFLGYLCKYNIPQSHRGSKIFWHLKYI